MQEIFVGRQPIYNRNLGIFGYEMLFRSGEENYAGGELDDDRATSQVIVNTFMDMGLDNLVGKGMASIILSEQLLFSEDALSLPSKRVILEIQPSLEINDKSIQALQQLKAAGFTLALKDFSDAPNFARLLKIADIFKLNIRNRTQKENIARLKSLKQYHLKILAEKVESLDEYETYSDLGFDYFQGYFLSQPRIIKSKTLETSRLSVMQLLSTLHNSQSDIAEVETAIASDLSLSYKLLKLINSAFFNLPGEVESVKQAVVYLGRRQLSSWASMLALSNMSNQPIEMIKMSMVRAKTCELIAAKLGFKNADQFFTAGMFSALDILMEQTLDSLVSPLPLADDVKLGILEHKGSIGTAVKISKLLETSAAERISIKGISKPELSRLYLQADNWAEEVTQTLH